MASPVIQFKRGLASNVGLASFKAGEPGFTTDKYDFYIGLDATASNQKFFGSARYWTREDGTNAAKLKLVDKGGTNSLSLKAPDTLSGVGTYIFPDTTDGATGEFLKLNSYSGNVYTLEWAAVPSGSFTLAADSGSNDTFTTGETLTFEGGEGIDTVVSNNKINIAAEAASDTNAGIASFRSTDFYFANTYQVGVVTATTSTKGIASFDSGDFSVSSGNVTLADSVNGAVLGINGTTNEIEVSRSNGTVTIGLPNDVTIANSLNVNGNVTIGGTTLTLTGEDVFIKNKDIVLGYTTNTSNADASTDTTANHAGVAIASTEGSPVANFNVSGINTLPNTYKQMMWFKSGTLGFSTDAFAFNYSVAIGTTTMANGLRFKVGSGITMTETAISATTFIGSLTGTATSTTNIPNLTGAIVSNNTTTSLGSFSSSDLATAVTDETGSGSLVFATSPTLVTPKLGIATATSIVVSGITTSDGFNATTGNDYKINGTSVLTSTTLGSGVVNSSLTSVGTLTKLDVGNINSTGILTATSGNFSGITTSSGLIVTGVTTTGTLRLAGTPGIGITGISTSATLVENSDAYLPTQKAVKSYVDALDLTTSLAGDSGTGSVSTSQTLTISGTANEVDTSVSNQTVTIGLPATVNITTLLDVPTVEASNIKAKDGTNAITITDGTGAVSLAQNLTVGGNLYVNGSTTQVNTTTTTIEDQLLELGMVDGSAPSSDLDKDIGVLLNYYTTSAKKAAMFWDDSTSRIVFADDVTESSGVLTVASNAYAAIEIEALWVNDCAGSSQVIACSGSTRTLENITVDGGTF